MVIVNSWGHHLHVVKLFSQAVFPEDFTRILSKTVEWWVTGIAFTPTNVEPTSSGLGYYSIVPTAREKRKATDVKTTTERQ